MSGLIRNLHIKNFKSVRDLSLECDRINIFIGKPNAGKSNILEAISLLGAGYAEKKFMEGLARYKKIVELFSDFNFQIPINVIANGFIANLKTLIGTNDFEFSISYPVEEEIKWQINRADLLIPSIKMLLNGEGKIGTVPEKQKGNSPFKKYDFQSLGEFQDKGLFLQPPHGENFNFVARTNPELRDEIQQFLKPNGLEFLLDVETQRMAVVQKTENSLLRFPLYLVPDTFQRYIFHLAAILSNRDSVLLFEEPESHSYAPYIYQLAQHILQDDRNNQYFLTTHNPYLLMPILQETKDVALFVTWFEDYQTHARRLSDDEIREMLDYGVDVFLNLDQFIPA